MKFDHLHSRFHKSLKCKDCSTTSNKVYHSIRYDVNLCATCLMLRIKEDLKKD